MRARHLLLPCTQVPNFPQADPTLPDRVVVA